MADIIQLLPDNIANQIAAGEVIQRPASVVKELLENAIDAGATEITLVIKDAGKTLIQVMDNGRGMSPTDSRMAFERHATSKIREAKDLFEIKTKGFRGEALASIAAIAHVELLTKRAEDELGQRLIIHGSKVEKQEVVQTSDGSNLSVKNLFYNIPARRKFLKSDPVELRHIMDEFHRVALVHSDIHFSLINNGNEVFRLTPGNFIQRIINIFGRNMETKLLPVSEQTDIINITGYVGKVEAAKKNSSEQFIFVNQRYIRSNYLNHAIKTGYDLLLQKDQYPIFFIQLEIDPSKIDINVHPTKTEIKFDEERLIYNYLRVSIKHALGKFIVSPTLDFDTDTNFVSAHSDTPASTVVGRERYADDAAKLQKENLRSWEKVYEGMKGLSSENVGGEGLTLESEIGDEESAKTGDREPYQLHQSYIVSHIKSGYLLIDQQLAHQRILFEKYLTAFHHNPLPVQKELFPIHIEMDAQRAQLITNLLPKLNSLGFEIGEFGKNGFIIQGTPAGMTNELGIDEMLRTIADQVGEDIKIQSGIEENLACTMAQISAVKRGKFLSVDEMKKMIDDLFACETPFSSPNGRKTFMTVDLKDIQRYFES